jgi:hypothetical protein
MGRHSQVGRLLPDYKCANGKISRPLSHLVAGFYDAKWLPPGVLLRFDAQNAALNYSI